MTVRNEGTAVHLVGNCFVEDAEPLLRALANGAQSVDLSDATRLHTALVQLLLAARPRIVGMPDDPFLREHVLSTLIPSPPGGEGGAHRAAMGG